MPDIFSRLALGPEKDDKVEKGPRSRVSSAQRKPDFVVAEWKNGVGLFDVFVPSVVPDGDSRRSAVDLKAQEKETSFIYTNYI